MPNESLAEMPLFEGLSAAQLDEIDRHLVRRSFAAGQWICRQGDPGDCLFVLLNGLADVLGDGAPWPRSAAESRVVGRTSARLTRLRRGDVVGEISLLTGEPRSVGVVATLPTDVLELSRTAFAKLVAGCPPLALNVSRILSRRLVRATAAPRRRGEAVGLVIGEAAPGLASDIFAATAGASPGTVGLIDLRPSLSHVSAAGMAERFDALDALLAAHRTVLVSCSPDAPDLLTACAQVDRTLLVASADEVAILVARYGEHIAAVDVVLLDPDPVRRPPVPPGWRVVLACRPDQVARRMGWLGRHLARTKLGLVLGAGGAKGYAHVGALHVLERAGYAIDYVAGTSMGGLVGALVCRGLNARQVEATLREAFTPQMVDVLFRPTMSGQSAGRDAMVEVCHQIGQDATFAGLQIPLAVVAADLTSGQPVALTEGPVWSALLATTAIPGLFPPVEVGTQRLVDGVILSPVPTDVMLQAGADITLAINVLSRQVSASDASPPDAAPTRRPRLMDVLTEALDLAQLETSARQAGMADVSLTPRLGGTTWRDFHMVEAIVEAGRVAAHEQLEALSVLARPRVNGE